MGWREVKSPVANFLLSLLAAMAGIGLMIFGVTMYRNDAIFMRTAVQTTAVVTDIQIISRGESLRRRVYIRYFVDGTEHEGLYRHFSVNPQSDMRVGQHTTIYYDPNNPQSFRSSSRHYGYLLAALIGAPCIMPLFLQLREGMRKKNLVTNNWDELGELEKLVIAETDYSYPLGGFICIWILMIAGGTMLYFWRQTGVFGIFFGLFLFGIGVYVHIHFILHKFGPIKKIQAMLVSIDKGSKYMECKESTLYVLKFKDEHGKFCYYIVNDVSGYEVNRFYEITKKNATVFEVRYFIN